ncbi:hypothetical protein P3T73_01985 [Kiritimatiellota bacterium B12222]|nr:hypothetical protein P3T73_01985 [Kiritimatiellota bacterium B12222]
MKSLRLTPTKWKSVLMLFLSTLLTTGGVFMFLGGEKIGLLIAGFFGLCSLIFVVQLFPNASYLVLDDHGFSFTSMFKTSSVSWQEIDSMGVIRFRQNMLVVKKMVGWSYHPTESPPQVGQKMSEAISGFQAALPETYGMKAEALLDLMLDYQKQTNPPGSDPA